MSAAQSDTFSISDPSYDRSAKMLGKILCDDAEGFWDQAAWTMTVTDENGLTLFQLHVMGTEAAAIGGRRPVRHDAASRPS
jgi:hypothetical protein